VRRSIERACFSSYLILFSTTPQATLQRKKPRAKKVQSYKSDAGDGDAPAAALLIAVG
jgi:hypothetical protein